MAQFGETYDISGNKPSPLETTSTKLRNDAIARNRYLSENGY